MTTGVLLIALLVSTQASPSAQPQPQSQAMIPSVDYEIGPGDVLSVHVSGVEEFDFSTRVSNSGRIHVPHVGVVLVAGQTAVELEQQIAKGIMERELVKAPAVRIQIEQYRSQPTYVVGEVNTPGQFVITREMYLLDLIGRAGGLLPTAAETVFLYRQDRPRPEVTVKLRWPDAPRESPAGAAATASGPAGGSSQPSEEGNVVAVDLQVLAQGTHPELNIRLQGGDVLYVPRRRADEIYVIGDVKVPGAYNIPRGIKITAAQAIIYAGGPNATASRGGAFLMRHDATGTRESIPVHFQEILAGKQPDIPVRADDIIFVPNSAVRTVAVGLLNMIPTLVQQFLIF